MRALERTVTVCADTCDRRDLSKSQSEEEISASDDSEYGESEEEEPEDDGETDEDEKLEEDGETGEDEKLEEDDETGEDDSDSEDDEESDSGPDLARGIGNIETSSDDDEDLNDLFPKEPEIEHSWRELDKDAPRGDEVDITWDETDHERVMSLSRTFNKEELLDMDFQAYLASSSEEEEEEQQVQKGFEQTIGRKHYCRNIHQKVVPHVVQ
ncbi:hypothetical protein llap_16911 [Limosa lapponica baueri]|uniref:Uncharacterized protein n=1 Tax=Limosa lapponica baueri TaxID=1758121 RepID=A0A2I0TG90_LIMLA|nr:hypothetical protein llap_16911 [Limosa lapponica baueri]